MIVRLLEPEDRVPAGIISHIAFHVRKDDMEAKKKEWEEHPEDEDWGAFDDDGTLMARIINNHLVSHLDGHPVMNGGIGAVSTLPEYRDSGAVRAIFAGLLPEARKRGEVISTLYPFSHAFYRKFGYETVCCKNAYELTPRQLEGFAHHGWVRQWKPGDSVEEYNRIYTLFAEKYNLSIIRDEAKLKEEHIHGEFWKDRHFVYLLGNGDGAKAYVVFQDEFRPESAKLVVEEAAWVDPDGFRAVLGFLARFTADYGALRMVLPTNMDLRLYVRNPYEVRTEPDLGHMVRVVNTEKLLSLIRKPEDGCFVIAVNGDGQIPENNGVWRVCGSSVTATEDAPDLCVSARALGVMAVGGSSLAEAEYREDVKISGNREILEKVFVRKPIYVGDHF